jgi:hypothetical protein
LRVLGDFNRKECSGSREQDLSRNGQVEAEAAVSIHGFGPLGSQTYPIKGPPKFESGDLESTLPASLQGEPQDAFYVLEFNTKKVTLCIPNGASQQTSGDRQLQGSEVGGSEQQSRAPPNEDAAGNALDLLVPISLLVLDQGGHVRQRIREGRIPAPGQGGQEVMADAVSREGGVPVAGIFPPRNVALLEEALDGLAMHVEQRTYNAFPRDGKDAREPGSPAAAQDPEQNCLRLVRARVAESDAIHQTGLQPPAEELPPDSPGQLFEVLAALGSQKADVRFLDVYIEAQSTGHLADETSVVKRFLPPQAVVQMQDPEVERPTGRKFEQDVQQAHGIRATGHGHANRVATLEHVITRDGFGD